MVDGHGGLEASLYIKQIMILLMKIERLQSQHGDESRLSPNPTATSKDPFTNKSKWSSQWKKKVHNEEEDFL